MGFKPYDFPYAGFVYCIKIHVGHQDCLSPLHSTGHPHEGQGWVAWSMVNANPG